MTAIVVRPGVTKVVVVEDITKVSISPIVGARGSTGLPGPPGPSGATGFNYTQSAPSMLWTINHNLGYKPAVDLSTVGGVAMMAEVIHVSNNQAQVGFTTPPSGSARLV